MFIRSDMFLWWPLPSSTSDEGSEQCFLTDGALACHKCSFPVDGGGGHYRKVGFYEHPLTLKKKLLDSCVHIIGTLVHWTLQCTVRTAIK